MHGKHALAFIIVAAGTAHPAIPHALPRTQVASSSSPCAVSDDAEYALTPGKPVEVGGGAMFVAAREQRYLNALRGLTGVPIKYKRIGSRPLGANALTFLDEYEVTYEGLEKPIVLYLDAYHYDDELKAPKGLTCGTPIDLAPPPPDALLAADSMVKLAIDEGATQDFTPIPLASDGTATRGVIFDRFRVVARMARAAAAGGKPLELNQSLDRQRTGTVVLAYPIKCEDRTIAPTAIDLEFMDRPAGKRTLSRSAPFVSGAEIATLVPGFDVPAGGLGVRWQLDTLGSNMAIKVTYAESCAGSTESMYPITFTPAKLTTTPLPELPAGAPPKSFVRLQVLIDPSGAFQDPTRVGGPAPLADVASETVRKTWKAEAARINGAPVVEPVTLLVRFR